MQASERILKEVNSFLTGKYFPGKWRIENFLVDLVRVRSGYYLHPFGFWWKIEDKFTKRTFLVNCENSTSQLISKLYKERQIVFVDIGSNLGWYSLLAKTMNSNSIVFAFEPMNSVREKLQQNLQQNGFDDIHVESCALGATSDSAKIWSYSENNGMHTLYPVKDWGAEPSQEVRIEVLDQYTTLIYKRLLPILVKLDVEGSEINVLKGSTLLLKYNNLELIVEINETMLNCAGASAEEVFTFLKSFGFSGYWISPDSTLVAQGIENPLPHRGKLPKFEGANYFFTKNKVAVEKRIVIR